MSKPPLSHCYVVPAFGRSPFLETCLNSLQRQRKTSPIIISTSTPFPGIDAIAKHYNAELYVHSPNLGIVHDWNQGIRISGADWVTLAHQDDVYLPDFGETVINAISATSNPTLVFTDYAEIADNEHIRRSTRLLLIKQVLLQLGFLGRVSIYDQWSKLNTLRFGSPIPCPSVTFKTQGDTDFFEKGFRLNMDWAAWIRRAQEPGGFIWIRKELMYHRIHESSETTEGIKDGSRQEEDMKILRRLWPTPIAKLVAATYGMAYKSNSFR